MTEKTFEVTFSSEYLLPFVKAYEEGENFYLVVKASDTSLDRDNERVSPQLIAKMKDLANQGVIKFLDHHKATLELGVVVGYEEHEEDPYGFYPIIQLNKEHPLALFLFKKIKSGSADNYGVSIGGRNPKVRAILDPQTNRPCVEILDAEIDHIALTRPGYAANPNTGIVRAIIKEVGEETIQAMFKEIVGEAGITPEGQDTVQAGFTAQAYPMGIGQPAEVVPIGDAKRSAPKVSEAPSDHAEQKRKKKVAKEETGMEEITFVTDEQFLAEMSAALEHARTAPPTPLMFERERQHGFRGFYMCPTKPAVWAHIPDNLFADQVGYFFPMSRERFDVSYRYFLKNWETMYSPKAAVRVFERFLRKGLEYGLEFSFFDAPLLATQLPPDIKTLLKDYDPGKAEQLSTLFEIYDQISILNYIKGEQGKQLGLLGKERNASVWEQAVTAVKERMEKFGVSVAADATPEEVLLEANPKHFADPVTLRYPITSPASIFHSIQHFYQHQPKDQITILATLVKAAKRFGIVLPFNPDNPLHWLLPENVKELMVGYTLYKDEDTEEKRKVELQTLEQAWKEFWQRQGLPKGAVFAQTFWQDLGLPRGAEDTPTEVPAEELPKPQPPAKPVTETEFIVSVPLGNPTLQEIISIASGAPASPDDALADFVLGAKWRIDAVRGRIIGKWDDGSEVIIRIEKAAGVAYVEGIGRRVLWGLEAAITDKLQAMTNSTDTYIVALSPDLVAFVTPTKTEPPQFPCYVTTWQVTPEGEVIVGSNPVEVELTYVPKEQEPLLYEQLRHAVLERNRPIVAAE